MFGRNDCIKITVLLIIWVIIWMVYNVTIRPMYPNPLLDDPLTCYKISLPDCMKCYIKEVSTNPNNNDCTKEDIDGWTLGHIAIYYTIGLFVPTIHFEVFIISMICEIWEYFCGWRARWVVDPLTNLLGYQLGVWHSQQCNPKFPLNLPPTNKTLFISLIILAIVLHMNCPSMLGKFIKINKDADDDEDDDEGDDEDDNEDKNTENSNL